MGLSETAFIISSFYVSVKRHSSLMDFHEKTGPVDPKASD
jgi:hypothetical protein